MTQETQKPAATDTAQKTAGMNWKRAVGGVLLIVPIVGLLYFGLKTDPRSHSTRLPGHPAPLFELSRMDDGGTVSLAAERGNIVVLNFWASWCLPCRDEHPELIRLANSYAARGVRFYGILDGDTEAGARRFFDELGPVPYPTLLQGTSHTGIDYGLTGVPETFVIDREGVVAYKLAGPLNPATPVIRNVLDSLLTVK
jgi:cytochrome c biogenesis protein CcmG/thiol:disulfide interchange protein DsbE